MADVHRMAEWLLLLISVVYVYSHQSSSEDSSSHEVQSNNEIDSAEDGRRSQVKYAKGVPGKDHDHEEDGLPIETATTTTTTTSTPIMPPMHPRYRRIYNPDESTSIEEYPFMAALLVNKQLWCGAAVVDRDTVLTAAHCLQLQYNNRFFREYVKMLTVRVGSTNATAGGEVLRVTEITFHPNYKPETLEFNVAVLKLHKNITFGKKEPYVEKIDYSRNFNVPMDHNVTFLGWGSVLGSGGVGGSVLLQKVDLPVYDLTDCQDIYGKELVSRSNFCAGFITLPKNVCNHDAGGPAILGSPPKLVGVLSFSSRRCDTADQPAVFTNLGAVSDWLETIEERKPAV